MIACQARRVLPDNVRGGVLVLLRGLADFSEIGVCNGKR